MARDGGGGGGKSERRVAKVSEFLTIQGGVKQFPLSLVREVPSWQFGPKLVGKGKAGNSNMQEFFCITLYNGMAHGITQGSKK